jgi:hypothetical protein
LDTPGETVVDFFQDGENVGQPFVLAQPARNGFVALLIEVPCMGEDYRLDSLTFRVWKGPLYVKGVEDGEEMTLGPGDFVQIKAGYYYQLHNPGTEQAIYCQFRTIPAVPAKKSRVWFSESRRGKQEAASKSS